MGWKGDDRKPVKPKVSVSNTRVSPDPPSSALALLPCCLLQGSTAMEPSSLHWSWLRGYWLRRSGMWRSKVPRHVTRCECAINQLTRWTAQTHFYPTAVAHMSSEPEELPSTPPFYSCGAYCLGQSPSPAEMSGPIPTQEWHIPIYIGDWQETQSHTHKHKRVQKLRPQS